jgi:hypothetical protein
MFGFPFATPSAAGSSNAAAARIVLLQARAAATNPTASKLTTGHAAMETWKPRIIELASVSRK